MAFTSIMKTIYYNYSQLSIVLGRKVHRRAHYDNRLKIDHKYIDKQPEIKNIC